jgi:hypothetical protein
MMVSAAGNVYFDPIGIHIEAGDTVRWVQISGFHSTTLHTIPPEKRWKPVVEAAQRAVPSIEEIMAKGVSGLRALTRGLFQQPSAIGKTQGLPRPSIRRPINLALFLHSQHQQLST